jgi:hypothetical protein
MMDPPISVCLLIQLPQELLEHIFSHITAKQDISNLSRTCKALHAKTTEHLYKNITMKWQAIHPTRPLTVFNQHAAQSLRPNFLLQTILAKPEYAQSITSIKLQSMGIGGYWSSWDTFPRRKKPLEKRKPDIAPTWTVAMQRLVTDVVRKIALEEQRDDHGDGFAVSNQSWCDSIFMYDLDATIALLIWICPNLVSLDLGFHIGDDVLFLPRLLEKLSFIGSGLQAPGCHNLRKITLGRMRIAGEDEEESGIWTRVQWTHSHMDWRGYWAFFWCQNIQEIEMNLKDEITCEGFRELVSPPICSTLATLRLRESTVTPDRLARLLLCTPALKKLDYEYWTADKEFLVCESLSTAFSVVKSTLEHLRFVCHIKSPTVCAKSLVDGACHFHDFPVLSSLHLSPTVLLGCKPFFAPRIKEVVPPSLKELCFADDSLGNAWDAKELTSVLYDFIEGDWGATAPRMQRVYVTNDNHWFDETGENHLRNLCEANGLEYDL